MFIKKRKLDTKTTDRLADFSYINQNDIYMDSACQSMRPQSVINALEDYYKKYNSCGERVKYKWGQEVDKKIDNTRNQVLDFLKLPKKDYVCSFTLNTTFGLNLILNQLPNGKFKQIITSEIEHNSVFLPTIELSKRLSIKRLVLKRGDDGSLIYDKNDLQNAIIVVNAVSNIDGRSLVNLHKLIKDAHDKQGIVIVDSAQAMAHQYNLLSKCDADAICFSGHKLYSSSLGIIVAKKSLLRILDKTFIGGGMVLNVQKDGYELVTEDHISNWLEPGLQAFGEIIALGEAIKWLTSIKINGHTSTEYIDNLSKKLFDELKKIDNIILINKSPSPVISFYSPKIDSHRLAIFLSTAGIMARSGYFCCHYYLKEKQKLPPLLRLSIGVHITESDIEKTVEIIKKFI